MLRAMPPPIAVSKSKLLAFAQCPRKVWLDAYSPELEEASVEKDAALATGNAVGAIAQQLYGADTGHVVSFERGIRAAVEHTRALLAEDAKTPIFEASFDYEGVGVRVDVLDRSAREPRLIEVKASTHVKEHHLQDCAIQAWTLEQLGLPPRQVVIANIDSQFVYAGDGRYEGLLKETDVTDLVRERMAAVPQQVAQLRATLAELDEPAVPVGPQCGAPHGCQFYAHCAPPAGKYPVLGLGGSKTKLFALLHAGYSDVRDVPEEELSTDLQRRIWQQTRLETAYVDPQLRELARELGYPRYYLDFETIACAVPVWPGTRPFEALPFQWSCHIETAAGDGLQHAEFLDLSGALPLRRCAEELIAALGGAGPVLVYTPYERSVLNGLAARFSDLAAALGAIVERLVDLYPPTKQHYYHPAMRGSWSIKAVLPTVAPDLGYDALGEVRDGLAAQGAFLEAIAAATGEPRRAALRQALRDYCRQDTLALVRLVAHFAKD
jgi:hypothetical protein